LDHSTALIAYEQIISGLEGQKMELRQIPLISAVQLNHDLPELMEVNKFRILAKIDKEDI
jgi:hypothetical protein